MKKIATTLIYLTIVAVVFIHLFPEKLSITAIPGHQPCDKPLQYSIGFIDGRFNTSQSEIKEFAEKATEIWEKPIGKDLFVYNPQADLSINMVYDQRQALSGQIDDLEAQVQDGKDELQKQVDEYNSLLTNFKDKVDALNVQIIEWNSRGGAPSDEYNRLIKDQADLQEESNRINTLAQKLNLETTSYNKQVGKLNQKIGDLNLNLQKKPEEGLYIENENRIEIYFISDPKELEHTIAHELGHSLGLDHNNNQNSIMYTFTSQTLSATPEDVSGLNAVCNAGSN